MELAQEPSVELSDDIESIMDEAEAPQEEVIEEVVEPELPPIDAPNSWKKEFKDSFSGIDRSVQEYILQREQDFERGIGEKGQELASFRQRVEQFDNALSPLVQNWQMQGLAPEQGLQSLVAWSQALQSNPQGTLLELAKQYNVNLEETLADQPYVDPAIQQYEQQIRDMQAQMESFQNQQSQAQQNAALQQLDAFEKATDAEGNLKHPWFNYSVTGQNGEIRYPVVEDMSYLMQTGKCQDTYTAYETAVRLNPDIQSQLAEEQAKATAHARTEQAVKAKQVSKQSVSSKETGDINDEDLSLRDDIGKAFDELE